MKIIISIIIILISIDSALLEKQINSTCSLDTALKYNEGIILSDFTSFDQLNFECNKPITMIALTVHPNAKIILESSFDLNNLTIISSTPQFMIIFDNLKGFEMTADPFKKIVINFKNSKSLFIIIRNSNFNFIIKKHLLEINSQCDLNLTSKYEWSNFLFKDYSIVVFSKSNEYSKHICPLVFRNSYLQKLVLNEISSSFLTKNEFKFTFLYFEKLNSSVFELCLVAYHIKLEAAVFNQDVYKRLILMELNGVISSIQENLFKTFSSSFKVLCIRMQYINNLFVKDSKWLQYLNFQQEITSRDPIIFEQAFFLVLYQSFPKVVLYTYPDEDFCYFKDFPHQKLVFPVLKPTQTKNCSCSLLFLIQTSYLSKSLFDYNFHYLVKLYDLYQFYSDFIKQQQISFQDCSINENMQERIEACNFKLRLEQCSIKSIESNVNDFYFTVQDWEVVAKKIHLYIFLTNKTVSVLCIILNILTLLVIRNKNISKEFKRTFTYLRIYTFLNCFYLLISLTKFVCYSDLFECYFTRNYIYVRYLKLIIVQLIGNILKTASNITFVSFTLSRYIVMTSSKLRIFKIFDQSSIKKYLLVTTILSILINIHIYFITSTNNQTSSDEQGLKRANGIFNAYSAVEYEDYKLNFELSNVILLKAFQIIHIIFSDIFYIILVFAIDLCLLLNIIKKMKIKTAILVKNNVQQITKRRMLNLKRQIKNTENRMTNLVVFNGLNFLIFKLPLALISLYSLIYVYNQTNYVYEPSLVGYLICRYFKFCESLAELANLFYLFSIINQFFLIYKLDKNFNTNCDFLKKNFIKNMKIILHIRRNVSIADRTSENHQNRTETERNQNIQDIQEVIL